MAENVVGKMSVVIAANTAQLVNGLNGARNEFKNFTNGIKSAASGIGIALGGAAIVAGLRQAVGVAANFEERMSEVKAITGAVGKEFKLLEDDAKRLGSSTKFTAEQVATLQVAYGRLGFTTKEIRQATAATLDLAAATGEDLAKSADVAGSTVRGFGLDASETQRVVDVMAASFNQTALGLDNFTESMKYVAPIANAAGASIEETTALLGVLADAGIRGSTAGTSLRKIFTDMAKDGRPLRERLAELAEKGISLTDAFDEVGRTAQTSLLVLTKNTDKADQLAASFQNVAGEAKAMALIMQDNLNGEVSKLTSAFDALFIKLSQSNALRNATKEFTDFINGISGTGRSLDRQLEEVALGLSRGLESNQLIDDVIRLRQELGKPIETPQLDFLIEKYKLTEEQAARLYAIIRTVNEQLSFQEQALKQFNDFASRNGYADLGKAADAYKQKLYELILAQQIERDRVGKNAFNGFYDKQIAAYQRVIDIINEYVSVQSKKNSVDKTADSAFETIQSLEDKIKSLRKTQEEETPTGDVLGLQKLEKRIDAVKLKIELLKNQIAGIRPEIDFSALTSDPLKDSGSLASLNSNVVGGDAGTSLPQFSIPPVDTTEFLKSLKLIRDSTKDFVSETEGVMVDFSGLISGGVSDMAYAFGQAAAGVGDFGDSILKAVVGFARQLGEILIGAGVAMLAAKKLITNPYTAIAAGVALVAIAGAASAAISKSQSNFNSGGSSGVSSRSDFNTNVSRSDNFQDSNQLLGVIRGQDLYVILQNYQRGKG